MKISEPPNDSDKTFILSRKFRGYQSSTLLQFPSLLVFVDFDGIDGVLPEDVAARTDGRKGCEVGVGNPDGEGRVFLSECLSDLVEATETAANPSSDGVLSKADSERR